MSIRLKVSNSLLQLVENLATEIQHSADVFRPIYIVTQTEGMNIWLKQQLAERLRIIANIHFLKPNDSVHLLFRKVSGTYKRSISSLDFTWLLFNLLEDREFKNRYPFIAQYYSPEQTDSELKRMALAQKVADLFDQYQVYRTTVIEAWITDEDHFDNWQKTLWKMAVERIGENFPDKNYIGKFIEQALQTPETQQKLQEEVSTLYFFGISLITHYHYTIINSVSKFIDVQFLMQNPAPEDYWFEEKTEKVISYLQSKGYYDHTEKSEANPLLVSWGKLIQDTFLMIFEDGQTLNTMQELPTEIPTSNTLLHRIQQSIYHNEKQLNIPENLINDGTITINSCFNPLREVQVLYNYLVHLIDQRNENLSARDIVVMVSDIDIYASYIRAVFDNAPYRFRYTIADESFAVSDSLSNALIELLSLRESQFTSENIVRLLDFSALRNNFQINDVEFIRNLVREANIRFGIVGNKEDDTYFVSWQYGLKRIMYGLCMRGGDTYETENESLFPLDSVEGFQMSQAVHFTYFAEMLIQSVQARKTQRTLSEWVTYVEETVYQFIGEREENEDEDYLLLLKALENYNLLQEVFEEKVSYDVFLYNFLPILKNARRSHAFASSGITFCSLIPMRSIPFKVVALLGMDYDKFPRIDTRVSFDLMIKEKQRGDRNIKENDKHLFLETLVSAEDYLYISYTGQSVKDNSNIPPSSLVDELIDFIVTHTENPEKTRNKMVQKHPLHDFSKNYNSDNPNLYSYLSDRPSEITFLKTNPEIYYDFDDIAIEEFISFLKNPIKSYYNKVLNIYYQEDELVLETTEKFDLDNRDKWQLRTNFLSLSEEAYETERQRLLKQGKLPLKNMSKRRFQELIEEIAFVKKTFENLTASLEKNKVPVALRIGDSQISGNIEVFGNLLVYACFSKNELKYQLDAYIQYLVLAASGMDVELHYISHHLAKVTELRDISKSEALENLEKMHHFYVQGHLEILPFILEITKEIKDFENWTFEKFKKDLNTYFHNYRFPCTDNYHIREYQQGLFSDESNFEKFKEADLVLIAPLKTLFD